MLRKGEGNLEEQFDTFAKLQNRIEIIADNDKSTAYKANGFTIAEMDGIIYLSVGSEEKNRKAFEDVAEEILEKHAKNTPDHSWVAHHSKDDFLAAAIHLAPGDIDNKRLLLRLLINAAGTKSDILDYDQMRAAASTFGLTYSAAISADGYAAGV